MKIGYLKPGILLLVLLFSFRQDLFAKKRITSLKCEYIETPLGLDVQRPRLMWKVDTSDVPSRQTAYRILVSSTPELLRQGEADIWDSGKQKSDEQLVSYAGSTLRPHTRYWWRVEVWLNNKKVVSEPVWFETGKFSATDWEASWITDGYDKDYEPSPMFRKVFDVSKEVASARCYISGLGYYRLSFNGKAVNDHALDPGFTDYSKRVLYLTYDISGLLRHGKNCIGVQLGNGWFNEQTPAVWYFHEAPWRKRPQMIAEIHLCYTDGSKDVITTDTSWKTSTGPLLFDNLYVGSFYDARLEQKGWDTELFDDVSWQHAKLTAAPAPLIEAQKMPSITTADTFSVVSVNCISDTCYVFDMGINTAGVPRLEIKGECGTRIRLRHSEMLQKDGNIDQRNIDMHLRPRNKREIIQTDEYVLKGEGVETFIPPFTYHGFRYIELTSDRPLTVADVKLQTLRMHSDVAEVGSFKCSDQLLNTIFNICRNSYLSNLFGIPTDCPTREKNGWMADGFMVQEAGMFNYDSRNVYAKWVKDMIDTQEANGNVAGIAPTSRRWDSNWAGPLWDAAIFIVPSYLYRYTGDIETMRQVYPAAERYLKYIETTEDERGLINHGLGDWLFYKAETPVDFMATGFVYWDNLMMAQMAELTGRVEDRQKYLAKAEELKKRINDHFFDPQTVSYANKTQLSYALPLYLHIVPEAYRERLAENLHKIIAANDYSLDFGFIGSVMVPDVLAETGYAETAYRMLTKTTLPSWGYWIKETGATSLYETWDVTRRIGDASLNHPSMGAVSAWMYKYPAGIRLSPDAPAFKKILIQPCFLSDLDFVEASHESMYGTIRVDWRREEGKIRLHLVLPSTAMATVVLPGQKPKVVKGGEHIFVIPE